MPLFPLLPEINFYLPHSNYGLFFWKSVVRSHYGWQKRWLKGCHPWHLLLPTDCHHQANQEPTSLPIKEWQSIKIRGFHFSHKNGKIHRDVPLRQAHRKNLVAQRRWFLAQFWVKLVKRSGTLQCYNQNFLIYEQLLVASPLLCCPIHRRQATVASHNYFCFVSEWNYCAEQKITLCAALARFPSQRCAEGL